jgi:hypothetical protein
MLQVSSMSIKILTTRKTYFLISGNFLTQFKVMRTVTPISINDNKQQKSFIILGNYLL